MELVAEKYKKSDYGLIPIDWNVKQISEEIDLLTGFPFSSKDYSDSGIRLLRGSNIKRGVTDWSNDITQYWPVVTPELKHYILLQGDIVIAMDGSLVGRSFARLTEQDLPALLLQRVARVRSSKIEMSYLKEFICSDYFTKYCDTVKTSSAIPHISPKDIRGFSIPIPPTIEEQTAIATALSDADALINSLSTLIAKKRNIKQGAMQQLLKPKEGWEVKKLPDLVWFQEGPGVRNSQFTSSGVKLLNGTNIEDGKLILEKTDRYISENEAFGWYSHFLVDNGDILIACSGVTIDKFEEKVTVANSTHLPLCMNTSTMRFKIISNALSKRYFFHFLKSKSFKQQIGGKATGSAQLNFGPSHVKMVEISLPTFEEQDNIATILSDMDAEISALESKLEKYRKVKLGMMQNLLTGKIRLI